MLLGQELAVNIPNKKCKIFSRNFFYWVKWHNISFEMYVNAWKSNVFFSSVTADHAYAVNMDLTITFY